MQPHRRVAAVDPEAGDWLAALRASVDASPSDQHEHQPTNGQRGWLVGALDDACDGEDGRHAFLWAAFGDSSSKSWTLAHYKALSFWFQEGGEELLPRITDAAILARSEDDLSAGKTRMDQLLAEHASPSKGETQMAEINVAALIASAGKWGYQGAGDVLAALGVEDIAEFEGAAGDALRILEKKATEDVPVDDTSAPAPPEENTEEETDPALLQKYLEQCSFLPESPVLAWTKFQRQPGGPVWTLSLRSGLTPDTMRFAFNEMARATKAFEIWLYKIGGSAVLDSRDQTPGFNQRIGKKPTPPPQSSSTPPQASGSSPAPPPSQGGNGGGTPPPASGGNGGEATVEAFKISSIERDVTSKGDNLYKVRGGKYAKFGVTGYEEVEERVNALLQAAGQDFDVGTLALKQEWNVTSYNWTAHAERPAGEKYAKKVIDVRGG